jgi:hypothetical protein
MIHEIVNMMNVLPCHVGVDFVFCRIVVRFLYLSFVQSVSIACCLFVICSLLILYLIPCNAVLSPLYAAFIFRLFCIYFLFILYTFSVFTLHILCLFCTNFLFSLYYLLFSAHTFFSLGCIY